MKKLRKFLFLLIAPFVFVFASRVDSVATAAEINPFLGLIYGLPFIMWGYLAFWFSRGVWRFIFQPPSQDSWRFDENSDPYFYLGGKGIFGTGGSSVALRGKWLEKKIERYSGKRKVVKWQKELNALSAKYSLDEHYSRVNVEEIVAQEIRDKMWDYRKFGSLASKITCPHCHVTGNVWRNENATATEMTRETGLGAVIGRKTVTNKNITNLHCKNCETTWTI